MQSTAELIGAVFERMAADAGREIEGDPGDYTGPDGLLYCGLCHTPKQCIVPLAIGGETRIMRPSCMCRCRAEQIAAEDLAREQAEHQRYLDRLRSASLLTGKMLGYTFDRFEQRQENARLYKLLSNYVSQFPDMLRKNRGLMLWGPAGTGKTFAAACIANALLADGRSVVATSTVKILQQSRFGDEDERFMGIANKASLMVLDDLGAERGTDTAIERVYGVIDSRYRDNKPLIVTTNLTLDQIQHADDVRYVRIFSRIKDMCFPIEVSGILWRNESAADQYDEMRAALEG